MEKNGKKKEELEIGRGKGGREKGEGKKKPSVRSINPSGRSINPSGRSICLSRLFSLSN